MNTVKREELLQAFDENGQKSGAVPRSEAHEKGILHGAAHTFIYKWVGDELLILLQRRSKDKDSFPGMLDTSSAGHTEFGFDFLDTAVRELKEELGISVEPTQLTPLFKQTVHLDNVFHHKRFIDNEVNMVYALMLDVDPALLVLQQDEVSEVVWMSATDILDDIEKPNTEICMRPHEIRRVVETLRKQHT